MEMHCFPPTKDALAAPKYHYLVDADFNAPVHSTHNIGREGRILITSPVGWIRLTTQHATTKK
jgi:hypothetical protein